MFPRSHMADAAHFFGAAAKYKAGLAADAARDFEELPVLFPESALKGEALLWAGICSEKAQQPERALKLYGNALQVTTQPDVRSDALYSLAWAELSLADDAAAMIALDQLVEEFPGSPLTEHAYFLRGRLNFAKNLWEPAERDLLALSAAFPASEFADDAYFFAGKAAYNSSDYARAAKLFHDIPVLFPESPLHDQASIEGSECMIAAGNADAAAEEFERFVKDNLDSPLRPIALYDMGKALQRAGDFEAAVEQYRAASGDETTELAARSRFAIAECLAELDRSTEAIAELIAISQGAFPMGWAERAQLQVARLLERDGKTDEARQVYASVAASYGNDAAGMVALKAIDRLDMEVQEKAVR
jgi:TolA-binding protein